ncbi:HNH endonuclease [Streptomyces sp. NPDC057651]|uniref:HNH endonuclease n=1 Tax=unclassified Streptomyces TaxID=2593676 RepID=UPI0036A3E66F
MHSRSGHRARAGCKARACAERCSVQGCLNSARNAESERNGKPLRLEVDHLSGDWWDNRAENLRLLCPNCHAVTDTYRGRKKGSA